MKINSNTKVFGSNLYLVPYGKHHVEKYHMWMKNKELQELTASVPLTLNEEYEMQQQWREDDDKCTFIILQKKTLDETNNEIDSMIGDTNIFIKDKDERVGEIEIMIAEESARGQKLGWEAVILMLLYGIQNLGLKKYEAKITDTNIKSIQMFTKLQFGESTRSEVFKEITFEKTVTELWENWLRKQYQLQLEKYI